MAKRITIDDVSLIGAGILFSIILPQLTWH